jgi:hypothetical protein
MSWPVAAIIIAAIFAVAWVMRMLIVVSASLAPPEGVSSEEAGKAVVQLVKPEGDDVHST